MTTNPYDRPTNPYQQPPAPDRLGQLVDQLTARDAGVVRVNAGDSMLLLVPVLDEHTEASLNELAADLKPHGIALGILVGVTGIAVVSPPEVAVVSPPEVAVDGHDDLDIDQGEDNDFHARSLYCGNPQHCPEPYPGAPAGTPYGDGA